MDGRKENGPNKNDDALEGNRQSTGKNVRVNEEEVSEELLKKVEQFSKTIEEKLKQ